MKMNQSDFHKRTKSLGTREFLQDRHLNDMFLDLVNQILLIFYIAQPSKHDDVLLMDKVLHELLLFHSFLEDPHTNYALQNKNNP